MLQFILGRASSGKTYTILNRIKASVENGEEPILVVPEQFSFESEKAILDMLGEASASKALVLPFSRIYETIGRLKGGICGKVLSKSDKLILMKRAVSVASQELCLWGKYANSSSFAENMIKIIDEFKYNAVSSDDLRNQADIKGDTKLSKKLKDTALIFDTYEMLLGSEFIDPSDYMDKLYYMLEDCDFFKGKKVFFDGFKSFSGQQIKVIDRIISKAEDIVFTFTDDKSDKRELCLLSGVRKTEERLIRIARSHNVKIKENCYLENSHYESKDLKTFEECLFKGEYRSNIKMPNVTVCRAQTVFDEAEFAARNIRRIIREQGARFDDFVIIARDTAMYEDAIEVALKRNKINCFFDKKLPVSAMPISATVLSAAAFAASPTTENLFKFHKSGINILSSDEISELENYAFVWNIKAKQFKDKWNMNPSGLTDRTDKDILNKLEILNALREKAIDSLDTFKKDYKGTPKERAKAIVKLLEKCDVKASYTRLYKEYEHNGETEFASAILKSYSVFNDILDSIVRCFRDVAVSDKAFFDSLKTALATEYIGVTPQTADEVTFGDAERIRPARPKYAFILGVNQGIFPRISKTGGLFSNAELMSLKANGLNIPDKTVDGAFDEELLIYTNLCCPSREVYISFCEAMPNGAEATSSAFLEEICKNMQVNMKNEPEALNRGNLPETESAAFYEYCKRIKTYPIDAQSIKEVIISRGKEELISSVSENITAENASISPETAKKLYGNTFYMSPTKFDNYSRCKFMFFCRDAIKASKLYAADFNAMQRGTIVHYVLQKAVENYGKALANLSEAQISSEVDRLCAEYLQSVAGFSEIKNKRIEYLVKNIARTLKYVVSRLAKEFAQSDFEPIGCEIKIGKGEDIPEINVDLNGGNKLLLGGTVDRLDTFGEYVRIVDYKTGSRSFRLPDILAGQNMQMLLYLYAALKSKKFGDKPAGILYMNAKRIKEGKPADRRMNGLLTSEPTSVFAMDKENKGEFIPKFNEENPSDSYLSLDEYSEVFDYINKKLKSAGEDIFGGKISARPIDGIDSPACKYCDFLSVCRISAEKIGKVKKISNSEVLDAIRKEKTDNVG